MSPRFSIIIPHYDKVVTDERFLECIQSLKDQTFKDFEVLIYHDGPVSRPLPEVPWKVKVTEKRIGDWGHSLRSQGIKEASGDYIVHLNADGILFPDALEYIDEFSTEQCSLLDYTNPDLIVFPVYMQGVVLNGIGYTRNPDFEEYQIILTGFPPEQNNIDCMQLVMKRNIWLKEGAWDLRTQDSDGQMYPYFILKYKARYCGKVLGIHR